MTSKPIIQTLSEGPKRLALLIDPDHPGSRNLSSIVQAAEEAGVTHFLVGGSLIIGQELREVVVSLKSLTPKPVILFPGNNQHIVPEADGILLLSLISGRNPDFLIGQHVVAAHTLKRSGLELLPTGYVLIDGGAPTTVSYVSNTQPIPADKAGIAAATALAGEQLGLKLIYLDGGSGAKNAVPPKIISAVRREVSIPLIVGGGIRNADAAYQAWQAGADLLVVGNAVEEDRGVLAQIGRAMAEANSVYS